MPRINPRVRIPSAYFPRVHRRSLPRRSACLRDSSARAFSPRESAPRPRPRTSRARRKCRGGPRKKARRPSESSAPWLDSRRRECGAPFGSRGLTDSETAADGGAACVGRIDDSAGVNDSGLLEKSGWEWLLCKQRCAADNARGVQEDIQDWVAQQRGSDWAGS